MSLYKTTRGVGPPFTEKRADLDLPTDLQAGRSVGRWTFRKSGEGLWEGGPKKKYQKKYQD